MTIQRDIQIIILELENIRERCRYYNDQEKIDAVTSALRHIEWSIEERK